MIDPGDYDSKGSRLQPQTRTRIHRLRKWDRRHKVNSHVERNLSISLSELDRVADQLELPRNVRETASMIYRNVVEKGLARGRSTECSTASAIYISCRQYGVPRTLEEIAGVTKHKKKEIGKSYRLIAKGLKIHLPPVNAIDYIPRFTSLLGLPGHVETRAVQILKRMIGLGMPSGKGPVGIAAAAIYTACVLEHTNRTQVEISQVTGVTEVTVRNRYKDIVEHLDLDI
jgi:transcription initiation factor TFIIB